MADEVRGSGWAAGDAALAVGGIIALLLASFGSLIGIVGLAAVLGVLALRGGRWWWRRRAGLKRYRQQPSDAWMSRLRDDERDASGPT